MGEVICRHCGARNHDGGQCVLCGRSLGSIRKAVRAALVSAILMGAIWVGLSVLLRIQFTFLAMLYGAVVSGAVALYAKGYGIRFQIIASAATLAGILIADTLAVRSLWHELFPQWGSKPLPPFWEMVKWHASYDGASCFFMLVGFLTGFIIWRQPDNG